MKRRFGSILPALAKHCSAASVGYKKVEMLFICTIMVMDFLQMLDILMSVLQSLHVNFFILKALFLLFPTRTEQVFAL